MIQKSVRIIVLYTLSVKHNNCVEGFRSYEIIRRGMGDAAEGEKL